MERLKQALSAAGIAYKENEPLSAHCTFRIGGPADVFILPENEAQLCAAIKLAKEANIKYYLLGNGSNILFEDAGYRGAVINVSAMKSAIGILENICFPGKDPALTYDAVVVGADKMLSSLYMNAGAYGGEMKDVLVSVRYLTAEGEIVEIPAEQLDLRYRHSIFEENGGCILSAKFHLARGNAADIRARMNDLMARRKDKQPLDKPSAGSTFKRPVGAFAAALIDQCGLRGYRHGGAAVSDKHCGFVVNLGGATCADVLALCDEVRAIVKEKTGYDLEKEIRVVEA